MVGILGIAVTARMVGVVVALKQTVMRDVE